MNDENRRRHIPPVYESVSVTPRHVLKQLDRYLEANFRNDGDKQGPDYEFLLDWKAAVGDLVNVDTHQTAQTDRTKYIYPLCTILSRKLLQNTYIDRVQLWRELAHKIISTKRYSHEKWIGHCGILQAKYAGGQELQCLKKFLENCKSGHYFALYDVANVGSSMLENDTVATRPSGNDDTTSDQTEDTFDLTSVEDTEFQDPLGMDWWDTESSVMGLKEREREYYYESGQYFGLTKPSASQSGTEDSTTQP